MFPAGAAACCMPADEIQPLVPARLWPHPCGRVRHGHGRHSLCGKGKLLARQREINRRRPAMTKKCFSGLRPCCRQRDTRCTAGLGVRGREDGAVVMFANSLLLPGGLSLQVTSQFSSPRHQMDQQGRSQMLWKRSNCPNHQAQVRCSTKFSPFCPVPWHGGSNP